jgi:hypothetical protein
LCTSFVPHGIPGEFLRSSIFLAKKFPGNKNEYSIPKEFLENLLGMGIPLDLE